MLGDAEGNGANRFALLDDVITGLKAFIEVAIDCESTVDP